MFLQLLSYIGAIVGFVLLVLSIASGLYYISELVEEHTEPTKRLLKKLIYSIIVTFVLLLILTDSCEVNFVLNILLLCVFAEFTQVSLC